MAGKTAVLSDDYGKRIQTIGGGDLLRFCGRKASLRWVAKVEDGSATVL